VVNPETAIATTQSLQILADSQRYDFLRRGCENPHGHQGLFHRIVVTGKSVRIAARYQENGTLVATRIWASAQFNDVWLSPEGHVLHVDTSSDVVSVASESGSGVDLVVDGNTQFFFRQPQTRPPTRCDCRRNRILAITIWCAASRCMPA